MFTAAQSATLPVSPRIWTHYFRRTRLAAFLRFWPDATPPFATEAQRFPAGTRCTTASY